MLRRLPTAKLFLLAGLTLALGSGCTTSDDRPNVLLFLIDDLRWDSFPTNGNRFFAGTGFERLAQDGVSFRQAFVTTSLCCPSRATIFTGQLPRAHDVTHIYGRLADDVPIFPDLLREAGYETGYVGKWHLNRNSAPDPAFDRWVSFTAGTPYIDPMLTRGRASVQFRGHLTDILTEHAIHFLRQERDRPFFLTVAHLAPHGPYIPQDRFRGILDDAVIDIPGVGPRSSSKPDWLQCRSIDIHEIRDYVKSYYELVAGVDESVDQILDQLQESGELDDTLIILMSDNGMHLGEHQLGDKRTAYEASIRIPLLVRYPEWFTPGTTVDDNIALNLDIARTVLEAAGIEVPSTVGGHSLRDIASGTAQRDGFFYRYDQSPEGGPLAKCTPNIRGYRSLAWKYIESGNGSQDAEFFDLATDPFELVNVIDENEYGELVAAAQDSIRAEVARIEGF